VAHRQFLPQLRSSSLSLTNLMAIRCIIYGGTGAVRVSSEDVFPFTGRLDERSYYRLANHRVRNCCSAAPNSSGFSSAIQWAAPEIWRPVTSSATSRIISSTPEPVLLIVPKTARTGILSFPLRSSAVDSLACRGRKRGRAQILHAWPRRHYRLTCICPGRFR
jgi:hypothetical protein